MTATMTAMIPIPPMKVLLEISKTWLWIETFDDRLMAQERFDYRAVHVTRVGTALQVAYKEGFLAVEPAATDVVPDVDAVLLEISKTWLWIETFDDRLMAQERFDYRAVHVTRVGMALQAAYLRGFVDASAAQAAR